MSALRDPPFTVLSPGDLFHGRYCITRGIKTGGMGAVYEVLDQRTNIRRALKVMLRHSLTDDELRERFMREMQIIAEIESDHVVRPLDAGVDPATETPFLVMDLLRGEELGSMLGRRGALPRDDVLIYLAQAARALDKIHAAKIVHSDLKPENMFVTYRDDGSPCLKILDFGIASVAKRSEGEKGTRVIGTPLYMSPEQLDPRRDIDPRADLYGLGQIAYTLLVGEAYWQDELEGRDGLPGLLASIEEGVREPPSVRAARRGVTLSTTFDAWFLKATALRREERFDRATDQIDALASALAKARVMVGSDEPVEAVGPYRLLHELGDIGPSSIWLAEEVYDQRKLRDVALKLFRLPSWIAPGSPEAARFRDEVLEEARALSRVEHPNVVRFYALYQDDARTVIGLVMEYVAGKSLDLVLGERGRLEDRQVLDVGVAVAWALSAVHGAGLVHRDIKPGNVIQCAAGYKLIGFGIIAADAAPKVPSFNHEMATVELQPTMTDTRHRARAPGVATAQILEGDDLMDAEEEEELSFDGTPGYLAPECVETSARRSPATDLYALGATLFKLMTGELPTPGVTPRLDLLEPATNEATIALADVVERLLDPDPNARPHHAEEVARELERARSLLTVPSRSGSFTSPAMSSVKAALTALFAAEEGLPAPLAPLLAEVRRGYERGVATSELGRALGELGLGVVRYAFALGLAVLGATAAPTGKAKARAALLDQLRSAARPTHESWCYLARSLGDALAEADPQVARSFAFMRDPSLGDRLGPLLRSAATRAAIEEGAPFMASLFEGARALLGSPLRTRDVLIGDRRIPLSPWLPERDGRLLLPEAPCAPGRPWRAGDPASGERYDDAPLDAAVRGLVGALPDSPRELDRRPPLVDRDEELGALIHAARAAARGGVELAIITGPMGIGRTRLLEAAIEEADLDPERVLWARCLPERRGALRPLLRALDDRPSVAAAAFRFVREAAQRALAPAAPHGGQGAHGDLLEGVEEALLCASKTAMLALVVDDLQWGDPQTLSLLRMLVDRAGAGGDFHLLVIAAARNEPSPSAALRSLLGEVRTRRRQGVQHLALRSLTEGESAILAQAVSPIAPDLERAVVRGAGGVPYFVLHALLFWRETGAIAWRDGAWHAVDERVLRQEVHGVADLVEARIASYFDPDSAPGRAAIRALSAIALYGGGLGIEIILRVGGEEASTEVALEALVEAGIITVAGGGQEYSFAQEMVRQAVLNLVRQRPWFFRLHRALLDAIAESASGLEEATFLANGYEKLGARAEARAWLGRAMLAASAAGLFAEAAALGDRLAALIPEPTARTVVDLDVAQALLRAWNFKAAKQRLDRLGARSLAGPRALDLRRRIYWLEAARGLREVGILDPSLIVDADAFGDPVLSCEARMALAGVAKVNDEKAMRLAGAAVARSQHLGQEVEYAARSLRIELNHASNQRDLRLLEEDLRRAREIALDTSSTWQQINIEGDLAVIEAELGEVDRAIERMQKLAEAAESSGIRWQTRVFAQNLAVCLHRVGRDVEAAELSAQAAGLAAEAGDPVFRGQALSLRADALRRAGELALALESADEAERVLRERGGKSRALLLLRRAQILGAMNRADEALRDALDAQPLAEQHGDRGVAIAALLWEKLCLAERGDLSPAELGRVLEETLAGAAAARVTLRPHPQSVVSRVKEWLEGQKDKLV